jgi:hypothetical protein
VFPAAAILLGRYWYELLTSATQQSRRGLLVAAGGLFAILLLFTAYIMIEDPWTYWNFRTGIRWIDFEVFMAIFTALFGFVWIFTWLRKFRLGFLSLAVISPVVTFYIMWILAPEVDAYKGAREIGLAMDQLLPEQEGFRFHGQMLDSAMFYADRNAAMLVTEDDLSRFLDSDRQVFALVRTRARKEEDAFQGDYHIVRVIGNKAIVSNRPLAP